MKILFLEFDTERTWALASAGPGYIAAHIRRCGHTAAFMRIGLKQSMDRIAGRIEKEAADILGISLTTRQWQRAAAVVRKLRRKLDIPVIAGGLHPTFAPASVLNSEGFDAICLGEGEEAVGELLDYLETGARIDSCRMANIWVKGAGRPQIRPPNKSLDRLPFIARDFLDEQHGVLHLNTQRGCPFQCAFCAAAAVGALYGRADYRRRRSVENVMAEIRHLAEASTCNYLIFLDDTFTVDKNWVERFCRVYGPAVGIGFSINARVETVSPDLLARLAEAGCRHIVYGVESGSGRIRREVLNRPLEERRIVDAFQWTKQAGMMATANYMLGLPQETRVDIEQTLALNARLQPDDFGVFVFYPYPGTHLHAFCRQKKYLPDNWLELPVNNRHSILNLPQISKVEIQHYYAEFTKARERLYRERYGGMISAEDEAASEDSTKSIAAG